MMILPQGQSVSIGDVAVDRIYAVEPEHLSARLVFLSVEVIIVLVGFRQNRTVKVGEFIQVSAAGYFPLL